MSELTNVKLRKVEFVKSATRPSQFPFESMPEVAFAGRSNVGKSSLINALTQRKNLVKVSSTPGRTQLINFFNVNDALSLVDLPGYGFAKVPKTVKVQWGKMIEGYLGGRQSLAATIVIMDLRRGVEEDDRQLIEVLPHFGVQPILVFTKADKLKPNAQTTQLHKIAAQLKTSPNELLLASSLKRTGLEELWTRIQNLTGVTLT